MTSRRLLPLALSAGLTLMTGSLYAQGPGPGRMTDLGKREFEKSCASCHGIDGRGSGVVTPWLKKSPPDLTLLSKNNGGIFPADRVYKSISGEDSPAHGSREMPIWGQVYRMSAAEYYMDHPYNDDAIVRARILSLLEYINRMQKPR
jgi:mono/diheme cytochrome c family protein